MAKQPNTAPTPSSKPAASGAGAAGKVIGPTTSSPIKDGPSLKGECVGPKGAPYYER